jgi:hypothetical protein
LTLKKQNLFDYGNLVIFRFKTDRANYSKTDNTVPEIVIKLEEIVKIESISIK